MKEMPLVLAMHPTAEDGDVGHGAEGEEDPARAGEGEAPQPSWMAATIVKAITAWRCSLCTPMAAAWMAPAPSEARARDGEPPELAERGDACVGGAARELLAFDDDGHVVTPFCGAECTWPRPRS